MRGWNYQKNTEKVKKGIEVEMNKKTLRELEKEKLYESGTNTKTLTADDYSPVNAVCSKCGGQLYINNTLVLTTYPPKYQYYCKDCGNVEASFLHLQ